MTDENLILGELIAEQAAHLDAAQHRLLTSIRQFDEGEGWVSAKSCAHWLSWRVSWTLGTAREHVRVARALANLPAIDEALSRGEVSYCQARAMTRVATPANEEVLLMDAKLTTGAQLERICRKYRQLRRLAGAKPGNEEIDRYVRRRELDNGMVKIEAVLFPDEAAHVWACIDQVTKELSAAAVPTSTTSASDVSAETHRRADSASDVSATTYCPTDFASDVSAKTRRPTESTSDISAEALSSNDDRARIASTPRDQLSFADPFLYGDHRDLGAKQNHDSRHESDGACAPEAAVDEPCDGTGCTHTICILRGGAVDWNAIEARLDGRLRDATPSSRSNVTVPAEQRAHAASARMLQAGNPPSHAMRQPPSSLLTPPATTGSTTRFNRADGLVALARRYASGTSSKTPIEIVVTVPANVLQDGVLPEDERVAVLADGTAIDGNTARRLSCDAGIVNLVEDANGTPLTVSRRTRSIPKAIMRALLHRDKTCRFPGCTATLYLQGHHIEHWADGGATSLFNLLRLCSHHHRFLHEYGYRIEIDAAGEPVFLDPKGRQARDVPTRIQRDDLGWQHVVHANRDLDIEPRVPGWDGEPVSYNDVCHVLYLLDEGRTTTERVCGKRTDVDDSAHASAESALQG